jgi:predicted 3-demethylubiquinone-9 3-methyltransferase (glyoxalase superfamily)
MYIITPCLWFSGNAEEAAKFYSSLFPNSHVDAVHRAPSDPPSLIRQIQGSLGRMTGRGPTHALGDVGLRARHEC